MSEYIIARKSPSEIGVVKFEDGDEVPEAQYTVRLELGEDEEQHPNSCDCPRWTKRQRTKPTSCRHTEMVQEFLNKGEPSPYITRR